VYSFVTSLFPFIIIIIMYSLLWMSFIALGSFAAAAPLCSNITDVAGGGLPAGSKPLLISPAAVKDFQLALFLENLEASFFSSGLANITKWGTDRYPNNTIEIVEKVIVVSDFSPGTRQHQLTPI